MQSHISGLLILKQFHIWNHIIPYCIYSFWYAYWFSLWYRQNIRYCSNNHISILFHSKMMVWTEMNFLSITLLRNRKRWYQLLFVFLNNLQGPSILKWQKDLNKKQTFDNLPALSQWNELFSVTFIFLIYRLQNI